MVLWSGNDPWDLCRTGVDFFLLRYWARRPRRSCEFEPAPLIPFQHMQEPPTPAWYIHLRVKISVSKSLRCKSIKASQSTSNSNICSTACLANDKNNVKPRFMTPVWGYPHIGPVTWWRHHMKTFCTLLALCEVNPSVTGGFTSQMPVTQSFGVFFDLCLNKRLC